MMENVGVCQGDRVGCVSLKHDTPFKYTKPKALV